jgi:hypothetical protein
VTPHVIDGAVVVDVVADVNDLTWRPGNKNTPTTVHRVFQSAVAVPFGGTVSAIGTVYKTSEPKDATARELAIYVTVNGKR